MADGSKTIEEGFRSMQLAGHAGDFKSGEKGTILKKANDRECQCFKELVNDVLYEFVPEYFGEEHEQDGTKFLKMQDLLETFKNPSVMDCKIGLRTYLEDEVNGKENLARKDLYEKMIKIDPDEPNDDERTKRAILSSGKQPFNY